MMMICQDEKLLVRNWIWNNWEGMNWKIEERRYHTRLFTTQEWKHGPETLTGAHGVFFQTDTPDEGFIRLGIPLGSNVYIGILNRFRVHQFH
jgi:hypothetical protein